MQSPLKIKWLVAHEPEHLFIRTAEAFAAAIKEEANIDVEVEIITKQIFKEKYEGNLIDVMSMLEKGEIQMTQTQVHVYGNRYLKDFLVLDMPFLFEDHDHATRVLEGPVGEKMCADLAAASSITGLAFTYSGGWRIIGSDKPLKSLEDLSSCKIRVNKNSINYDTMLAIGAKPVKTIGAIEGYGYDKISTGELDAVESTYLRFLGDSVLKTNHSMFLTNISINSEFFNGLDPEIQAAFKRAALKAAKIEREESIADAEEFERTCIEKGIEIYQMSEEDRATFKDKVQPLYTKYEGIFGKELFDNIAKA